MHPPPMIRAILRCAAFIAALALGGGASAQYVLGIGRPTMRDLVRWSIDTQLVPPTAWPAIDEAFAKLTATHEGLDDRSEEAGEGAHVLAEQCVDAASLDAFDREMVRRIDRVLAEERRFDEGLRAAIVAAARPGDANDAALASTADVAAASWRVTALLPIATADSRTPGALRLLSAHSLGLSGELAAQADRSAADELAAVGAVVEQLARAQARRSSMVPATFASHPAAARLAEPTQRLASSQEAEIAAGIGQLHRALRRHREALIAFVPEEARAAARRRAVLSSLDVPWERLGRPLLLARRIAGLSPDERRRLDAAIGDMEIAVDAAVATLASQVDAAMAAGEPEALEKSFRGESMQALMKDASTFEDALREIAGAERFGLWERVRGGAADLGELGMLVGPEHVDEVLESWDHWDAQRLMGERGPPWQPLRMAALSVAPIDTSGAPELDRRATPEERDAIDAAIDLHAATWAATVAPRVARFLEGAPWLRDDRTRADPDAGGEDAARERVAEIARIWDAMRSADEAFFASLPASLRDRDPGMVVRWRVRRAAAQVVSHSRATDLWMGEMLPAPADPTSAIADAMARAAVSSDDGAAAFSIMERHADPLVDALRTVGRRIDQFIAIRRDMMSIAGAAEGESKEEFAERLAAHNERCRRIALMNGATLAEAIGGWRTARDRLLAAWATELSPEASEALRAATLRRDHHRFEQWRTLAEEALARLAAIAERGEAGHADAVEAIRREHARRQDAMLTAFAARADGLSAPAANPARIEGFAEEYWIVNVPAGVRMSLRVADEAVRAVRDALLVVGDGALERVPAARAMLSLRR